jgi:disulfide bond formation protein DsbB
LRQRYNAAARAGKGVAEVLPMNLATIRSNPPAAAAIAVALAATATILGALFFEHVLGLAPCPLCLDQRIPYYVAIPTALLTAGAALTASSRVLATAGFAVIGLAMLSGAVLGAYHAGIEWKWWEGPQACAGAVAPLGGRNLLRELESARVVPCDEAAWRFLGLSLAGWNVLISLALAAIAAWGIAASRRAD